MIRFIKIKLSGTLAPALALSLVALLIHGKLPYMLPISVIAAFWAGFILFTNKNSYTPFKENLDFVRLTWPFVALGIIHFAWSFADFELLRTYLYKEIIYTGWYLFLAFLLFLYQKKHANEKLNYSFQIWYILLISAVVIFFFSELNLVGTWRKELFGHRIDHNYFAISLISGNLILIFIAKYFKKKWQLLLCLGLFILYQIPIFISGSRRAIVTIILFLIIWLFYETIKKFQSGSSKLLKYYLITTITISISGLAFFNLNSAAWRKLIIEKTFKKEADEIKRHYAFIFYRYTTLLGNTEPFIKTYNKLWQPEAFQGNNFIDQIVFRNTQKALSNYYNEGKYHHAFEQLKKLLYFSSSKAKFLRSIPEFYRNIPDSLFSNADMIDLIPYRYPIPYKFKNEFSISSLNNINLINISEVNHSKKFSIQNSDIKTNSIISSYIYLIPGAIHKIKISYTGCKKIDVAFKSNDQSVQNLQFEETDHEFNSNKYQKTIELKRRNGNQAFFFMELKPHLNETDTLTICNVEHTVKPLNIKNPTVLQGKQGKKYLGRINRASNYLKNLSKKNKLENKSLTKQQKDSLKEFISKNKYFPLTFSRYSSLTIEISNDQHSWQFECPENTSYPRAKVYLPSLPTGLYKFTATVNSLDKPYIYIKRYPEVNVHFFNRKEIKKHIHKKKNHNYKIEYTYYVNGTSSGLGALIIGVPGSQKGERFTIYNAKLELLSLEDTTLNQYQYNSLRPYISQTLRSAKLNNNQQKYLKFINNIPLNDNLLNSRIDRWRFAWFYFNQQSWYSRIFGNGFEYLKIYPVVFDIPSQKKYDYPHNPVISAFLYSGVLGGLLYLYFLLLSFFRYWKLRKKLALFGLLYLLAFSFTFFSGNSHFSVPAFALLSLIPFAYDIRSKKNQ